MDRRPQFAMWSNTANLVTGRVFPTATLLLKGKVLAVSGDDSEKSAELYDPATGTWSSTASLNTARYGQTSTLLSNGKVLVTGGNDNTAELYDPGTSNQIDDAQFFVRQHYVDFLNREKSVTKRGGSALLVMPKPQLRLGLLTLIVGCSCLCSRRSRFR